jgi:inner membrane protein
MQRALLLKAVLVVMLLMLLQLPLMMIGGIVAERSARQQGVVRELAATSFGRQVFAGPVLSLPYVEEYDEIHGEGKDTRVERRKIERVARFFPDVNRLEGSAAVNTKSRGLFKARVFQWRGSARGEFRFDGTFEPVRYRSDSRIAWGKPTLSLMVADPRGLTDAPALRWDDQAVVLDRGSELPNVPSGLHARLEALDPSRVQRFTYTLEIGLHGMESLAFVPLAREDHTRLASSWPHPSFAGQFLPAASQTVSDAGFDVRWVVSALASKGQQQLATLLDGRQACSEAWCTDRIEVRFIDPIDVYVLSDRALKYGFLFVALTFACFAMFEILKALPIHPAQYLLVGLALATFFLLLIALSEHIAFWLAYAVAAGACISLITVYLASILRGWLRALAFAGLLTALYSALYGLLASEDNALLLGSLLVFAMLATAMMATRNLDWYRMRPRNAVQPDDAPAATTD